MSVENRPSDNLVTKLSRLGTRTRYVVFARIIRCNRNVCNMVDVLCDTNESVALYKRFRTMALQLPGRLLVASARDMSIVMCLLSTCVNCPRIHTVYNLRIIAPVL
jgi:hypothetical protein